MSDELPITGDNPLTTNIRLIHSLLVRLEDQLTGLHSRFRWCAGPGRDVSGCVSSRVLSPGWVDRLAGQERQFGHSNHQTGRRQFTVFTVHLTLVSQPDWRNALQPDIVSPGTWVWIFSSFGECWPRPRPQVSAAANQSVASPHHQSTNPHQVLVTT